MALILEITAEGWVAIIGAIGALVTTIGVSAVAVIKAIHDSNTAAQARHEEVIDKLSKP